MKALAILLVLGCAGSSPRAKTEREASADASACDATITSAIFEYAGPRSGFCAEVQKKVDLAVASSPECRATYQNGAGPDVCAKVRKEHPAP